MDGLALLGRGATLDPWMTPAHQRTAAARSAAAAAETSASAWVARTPPTSGTRGRTSWSPRKRRRVRGHGSAGAPHERGPSCSGGRSRSTTRSRERLNVFTGLSIFASDNISSSAYATEEIMRVLLLAGAGALALTMPITIAIVVVLAIVVVSYRQTIAAYPTGGGSYIVASENLGRMPGLTAAAALLTDYVLTVAVSIAAGVAALTSILPGPVRLRVPLGGRPRGRPRGRQPARRPRERHRVQRPDLRLPRVDARAPRVRARPLRDGHDARLPGAGRRG